MTHKNIFGQECPDDSCTGSLIDYGDVEQEYEAECDFGWNVFDCPNLGFYKEGKWKGHSYCLLKRGRGIP